MINLLAYIRGFPSETRGSIAAMTGVMLSVLLVAAGGVVDHGRIVNARIDLQNAVDVATLSAALETDDTSRKVSDRFFEVALVVDVSSSMIQTGRFDPAVTALKSFVDRFEDIPNTRIAIVPFSSRVNYGLRRQSAFGTWNGAAAIPDRWQSPHDHYNSNYTRHDWLDGETFAMTRSTPKFRIDWMGCAEPRLDVAVETGDAAFAPSDSPPGDTPLVAMDHNPAPGKTFCPPPIEALTDDGDYLKRVADALTSQGSTRLDAGMDAGWNVLSPRWATVWGSAHAPAPYDQEVLKMLVFMTDGQMNTMRDPDNPNEYDWACKGAADCDADATDSLLATCRAINATGIEIHTVSYDKDADTTAMRACASSRGLFQIAESDSGGIFIEKVYDRIADRILARRNVLTN